MQDVEVYRTQAAAYTSGLDTMRLTVSTIEIVDDESFARGVGIRNQLVDKVNGLEALWKRIKKPMNALKDAVLKLEHETVDPARALRDTITKKLDGYVTGAKKERERIQKEVEAAADKQRTSLLREAEMANACGDMDKADNLHAQAAVTLAPQLPPAIPTVAGARITPKLVAKVTDLTALLKAIVEGKVDLMQDYKKGEQRAIVEVDMTALNAVVARKGLKLGWPGVTVTEVDKIGKAAIK